MMTIFTYLHTEVSAASRAYLSLMEEAVHLLSAPSGATDGPIAGEGWVITLNKDKTLPKKREATWEVVVVYTTRRGLRYVAQAQVEVNRAALFCLP